MLHIDDMHICDVIAKNRTTDHYDIRQKAGRNRLAFYLMSFITVSGGVSSVSGFLNSMRIYLSADA